jgi:hypothetical protein
MDILLELFEEQAKINRRTFRRIEALKARLPPASALATANRQRNNSRPVRASGGYPHVLRSGAMYEIERHHIRGVSKAVVHGPA